MSESCARYVWVGAAAVSVLIGLAACSAGSDGGRAAEAARVPVGSGPAEGEGSPVDTVDVFLEEYRISMPPELESGSVLRIVNVGFETHNLRFRLPGTDSVVLEATPDLNPGETRYLEIALPPRSYSVVCDFGGHSGRGMRTNAVVVGPRGG